MIDRLPALLQLHEADPNDADLLFMIASEHFNAGHHEAALPWLLRYVENGRDVGAGWGLIATCHAAQGRHDEENEALRRGIEAALKSGHRTMAEEFTERLEE